MGRNFAQYLEEKWVQTVKVKNPTPDGLFSKSADDIANYLHKTSKNLKKAMSRVNFYVNRAGDNLEHKNKFETVKELLRKKFGEGQE